MKTMQMFKIALVALFLCGGLIGCAKPAVQTEEAAVDMTQQAEVAVVDEKPMQEEVIPTHEQMAGMQRIHFDFDQFTLSDEARQTLGANAKYLQAMSDVKVVIEGHCDERGSDEYNLALGESRALAAKNYLISLGVSAKRLSVISYGEEKALVDAHNEDAWAQNRRAEFKAVK